MSCAEINHQVEANARSAAGGSMFDARCSMFDARCSTLAVRCSPCDVRCSMFVRESSEMHAHATSKPPTATGQTALVRSRWSPGDERGADGAARRTRGQRPGSRPEGPAAHAQAHSRLSVRTGSRGIDVASRTGAEHVRGEAPAVAGTRFALAPVRRRRCRPPRGAHTRRAAPRGSHTRRAAPRGSHTRRAAPGSLHGVVDAPVSARLTAQYSHNNRRRWSAPCSGCGRAGRTSAAYRPRCS